MDRVRAQGYVWRGGGGENIYMGPKTSQSVVQGWMNSPGQRRNIPNPSYHAIGTGAAKGKNNDIYWVQVFTTGAVLPDSLRVAQPRVKKSDVQRSYHSNRG